MRETRKRTDLRVGSRAGIGVPTARTSRAARIVRVAARVGAARLRRHVGYALYSVRDC